jgi:hypothetical protein
MPVPAKRSADGTRGSLAAVLAALCAVAAAGCGGGAAAGAAAGPGSRPASPAASASPSACSPWAGLDDLNSVTTWLRQLIGDEVIFGVGTAPAKRDGLAVLLYAQPLDGMSVNLPPQYALALRDSVLSVAGSPDKKSPEQLNTAANNAQSLAVKIGQLCF